MKALKKQYSLVLTMMEAHREVDLDFITGQKVLLNLSKSQSILIDARGQLARAHTSLLEAQSEIFGYEGCPKNVPMGHAHLVSV